MQNISFDSLLIKSSPETSQKAFHNTLTGQRFSSIFAGQFAAYQEASGKDLQGPKPFDLHLVDFEDSRDIPFGTWPIFTPGQNKSNETIQPVVPSPEQESEEQQNARNNAETDATEVVNLSMSENEIDDYLSFYQASQAISPTALQLPRDKLNDAYILPVQPIYSPLGATMPNLAVLEQMNNPLLANRFSQQISESAALMRGM